MNVNQKGSGLEGVDEEVLESSDDILKSGQHGGLKGLQQFYSPPELSNLIKDLYGRSDQIMLPTFDPTAGDGSLMKGVSPARAYGIEIDSAQIKNAEGSYQAIKADIKEIATLLLRVMPSFPLIVANPPFGLEDWSDPAIEDGKKLGSTLLTWKYVHQMLADDGHFVFVTGKNRYWREIADTEEAKGVYFVIECDDLFEGTNEPCAIAFGMNPEVRKDARYKEGDRYEREDTTGHIVKQVPRSMLDMVGPAIRAEWEVAEGHNSAQNTHFWGSAAPYVEAWEAVEEEYKRRRRLDKGQKVAQPYDVWVEGDKLKVKPSSFAQIALAQSHKLRPLLNLHNKKLNWFASYEDSWIDVQEAIDVGVLKIDPKLEEKVQKIIAEKHKNELPLYKIKDTQRVGYLRRHKKITCLKTDEERGFTMGEEYEITLNDKSIETPASEVKIVQRGENAGEMKEVNYLYTERYLEIQLINDRSRYQSFYDSPNHQEDIRYIVEHFDLPDPGDVYSLYPDEVEKHREILWDIQRKIKAKSQEWDKKHPEAKKVPFEKLRHFQVEDLSRLLVKNSGLLGWHQGLGKTIGALAWFTSLVRMHRSKDKLLIICPQDLIAQWQAEIERFTGRKLQIIKTHGDAVRMRNNFKNGGTGWFITYFEALATNGVRGKTKLKPEVTVEVKKESKKIPGTGRRGYAVMAYKDEMGNYWQAVSLDQYRDLGYQDRQAKGMQWVPRDSKHFENVRPPTDLNAPYNGYGYINPIYTESEKILTSRHLCPLCKAERGKGWNGMACKAEDRDGNICNYVHWEHRCKPMGSLLSVAFKDSAIVVDEGTMISGDYSKRSEVVRGLNARCKLLMTGTPIKEYIPHAFWPMWWALGNNSPRFPFGYLDKRDFEDKHAVIRYTIVANKRANRKVMPKVTGLSALWAMLPASVVRRRKEETGEPLVRHQIHQISVPLGTAQLDQMSQWVARFPDYFIETHPDSDVVKKGGRAVVEQMTPMLGLGQKLEWAATCPLGDADYEWTGVEDLSNWTPANLRTVLVAMTLVKQGKKVIVGSSLIKEAEFLAEALASKGLKVVSFVDESGQTINPKKRSAMVQQFQTGNTDVLVTTQKSLRFGHNVDAATAMVINGLPWEFEVYDQFINRHHRFTSYRPVNTYVIIPGSKSNLEGMDQPTVTRRKMDLLTQKADAAMLALDGRLIEADIEEVSEEQVTRQLMEDGFNIVGNEIPEHEVEAHWADVPSLDNFEIDLRLLEGDQEDTDLGPNAWEVFKEIVGDFTQEQWALPVTTGPEREFAPEFVPPTVGTVQLPDYSEHVPVWVKPIQFNTEIEKDPEPIQFNTEISYEIPTDTQVTNGVPVQSKQDLVAAIKDLKELHDLEALTDDEYGEAKTALLDQLKAVV